MSVFAACKEKVVWGSATFELKYLSYYTLGNKGKLWRVQQSFFFFNYPGYKTVVKKMSDADHIEKNLILNGFLS